MKTRYSVLLPAMLAMFLHACSTVVQIAKVDSHEARLNDKRQLVFENDTLRITYDFYSDGGYVKMGIFNKLNQPLYARWRESAHIIGSNFMTYWHDETVINGYLYEQWSVWHDNFRTQMSNQGNFFAIARRDEDRSFIPPQSELFQMEFVLKQPDTWFMPLELSKGKRTEIAEGKETATKVRHIGYRVAFTPENSPISFKEYLTFSTDDAGLQKFHVQNSFWISEVTQLQDKYALLRGDVLYVAEYEEALRSRPEIFPLIGGENVFLVKNNGVAPEMEDQMMSRKPEIPVLLWKDLRASGIRQARGSNAP
jgi:hypothetical protein